MQNTRRVRFCLLWFLCSMSWIPLMTGGTYTVTTTVDSLPGSLRQGIADVNSHTGPDTILFNIPGSDPGYAAGVWTIRPATPLPVLTDDGTLIDATSQASSQGDTNPVGPEIELDGTNAGETSGIVITGGNIQIKGLAINRFAWIAIELSGNSARNNSITGNYIGTDATGMMRQGNGLGGIWMRFGANGTIIGGSTAAERNIISGTMTSVNLATGNGIYIEEADSTRIQGNYIGVNRDATAALPNVSIAVCIRESQNTIVGGTSPGEGNIIAASGWTGIVIRMPTATRNTVCGNFIGTDALGQVPLGNAFYGVLLDFGARGNTIGPGNTIMFNGSHGVVVNHDSSFGNVITRNHITHNGEQGIANRNGGNRDVAPPQITAATTASVTGTSIPGSTVEIFSDSADEGAVFQGSVLADAVGNFLWNGAASGLNLTATCTDTAGNTSAFSVPIMVTGVASDAAPGLPGEYTLQQSFPNPFNPTAVIRYGLPERSPVTLAVFDALGRHVVTLVNGEMSAGSHEVTFNASALASGVYFYRMQAGGYTETRRLVLLR